MKELTIIIIIMLISVGLGSLGMFMSNPKEFVNYIIKLLKRWSRF